LIQIMVERLFHSALMGTFAKYRSFNRIWVVREGTAVSFSTVLAPRVLEKLGSLLALCRNCLLFLLGLRALA
jgi:hypothetical protein